MTKITLGFSVTAVLFFAFTIYVGNREFALVQLSQVSASRQFEKLSKFQVEQGFSLLSERIVLNACRDALIRMLGRLQPSALRARVAQNCAEISERITSASPAASYAFYIEALAQFESADFPGFNESYVSSQMTGPNESWIVQARFVLAERGLSELNEAAGKAHEKDISVLLQSRPGLKTIAKRYVRQPAFRDRVANVVDTLPETDQRRFVTAIRDAMRAPGSGS